ncbi:MmgE/PrpD family protein [Sphingomonas bisphenolicum]|uniref:MmgE/PrpD family protein n=1 Tax=Sphingomonas bisphenolicum TaxID=296544 RepID=UPI0036F41876
MAAAGYCMPSVRRVSEHHAVLASPLAVSWDGIGRRSVDDAVFVNSMAAHALDFDDVDIYSSAHLSCIVVPVLLAENMPQDEEALLDAILTATVAAGMLADWLGPDHYRRGWHATSTIGTIAATVSLARYRRLSPRHLTNAVAIAASQMSGLQGNFGSDAKAMHAGFAALAARRAVDMAALGLTGNPEILTSESFCNNYGPTEEGLAAIAPPSLADRQLTKFYPCCFAIHRGIAAVLEARRIMGDAIVNDDVRFILTFPAASHVVLLSDMPVNGTQAAFSAPYCCAAALRDGTLDIGHLTKGFGEPRLFDLARRFNVSANETSSGTRLHDGYVTLDVTSAGGKSLSIVQDIMPGSAADPTFNTAFRAKTTNCLLRYAETFDRDFPALAQADLHPRIRAYLL